MPVTVVPVTTDHRSMPPLGSTTGTHHLVTSDPEVARSNLARSTGSGMPVLRLDRRAVRFEGISAPTRLRFTRKGQPDGGVHRWSHR